ncbi:hypothetical protein DFH05DRAFT_1481291 [Lentinula detonsa]|uniref:Uncharacterized protein n=1 Tax=Lentinula detonsa TaxID=2804962 RepID=A0A9W8P6H6_9AGAR|nr:hypothetical protein DFH05DRAFT_1481291 [Lentinula detonsa]
MSLISLFLVLTLNSYRLSLAPIIRKFDIYRKYRKFAMWLWLEPSKKKSLMIMIDLLSFPGSTEAQTIILLFFIQSLEVLV